MKKIYDALCEGSQLLQEHKIPQPVLEAQVFLAHILNKDKLYLIMYKDLLLSTEQVETYNKMLKERVQGKPLQYIIKKQEFMSLDFYVNEHVLIPRADTEILVEKCIELSRIFNKPKILDVCTGSGCIAVSLAHYIKESILTAVDISRQALEVAALNAQKHGVQEKIEFIQSDLFSNINTKYSYDIIVSNPPYIPIKDIPTLMREVRDFEPHLALEGGVDGLDFYRSIAKEAGCFLIEKGFLLFEVGHDQADAVVLIMKDAGFCNLFIEKDLAGINRTVGGQKL